VEVNGSGEHSSLLPSNKNNCRYKFYSTSPNGRLKEDLAIWHLGACAIKLIMAVIVVGL
jgi:hypothetical protein